MTDWLGHDQVRYFSYGRYALAEGLRSIGLLPGDAVLLPSFICRDLLSAVHSVGAEPVYYPVDRRLNPSILPGEAPVAKAVLAVNYFGFPQELQWFREYCARTGAVLVEDNAHGLFSLAADGCFLGTRGDLGIFSLRKTIAMPDGAALTLNRTDMGCELSQQIDFFAGPEPLSFQVKQLLVNHVPLVGPVAFRCLTGLVRWVRWLRTGEKVPRSLPQAETELPGIPNPCAKLFDYLSGVDPENERIRRRALYEKAGAVLAHTPANPVFDALPAGVAPYMFPFFVQPDHVREVRQALAQAGMEAFPWPELPDALVNQAPEHYISLWGVHLYDKMA